MLCSFLYSNRQPYIIAQYQEKHRLLMFYVLYKKGARNKVFVPCVKVPTRCFPVNIDKPRKIYIMTWMANFSI